jgi:hypothetical protein
LEIVRRSDVTNVLLVTLVVALDCMRYSHSGS